MAYLTDAMRHRALHNPSSMTKVSFMGNTLVTKQPKSNVAEGIHLNMRDDVSTMHRSKYGKQTLTQGVRTKKAQSIMHKRIEYKG